jgi:hypothetical protein
MSNCPVENCDDVQEIKQAIHETKESNRFWIRILVVVMLAVAGIFIVIWADTRDLPKAKETIRANETRVIGIEKDVNLNAENISQLKDEIKELKVTQSTILSNTEDIKRSLRHIK